GVRGEVCDSIRIGREEMFGDRRGPGDVPHPFAILGVHQERASPVAHGAVHRGRVMWPGVGVKGAFSSAATIAGMRVNPSKSIRLRLAGGGPRSLASHSVKAAGLSAPGCKTSTSPRSRRRWARIHCSGSGFTRGTIKACFSNERASHTVLYPPMAMIRS